ncbi:MAG TPA: CPBP family intramembrane glutamic endopeptidase [Candidatus Limnocylindria bacterium]|nr:CPBP family intramembrane glutamic endopeptidase [Candidatus Limnocylindria bacterium]
MTTESSSADSQMSMGAADSPSLLHTVFLGPNGLRAGWRVLIYLLLVFACSRGSTFAIGHIAPIRNWLSSQPTAVITAGPQIFLECISFLVVLIPALIMMKIEKRPFAEYGLPVEQAFGKGFWQGVPFGFAMVTLLLVLIAAFRGYSLEGIGAGGASAVKYAILYGIGFLLVGFFEEFGFRGYIQSTLASGIGFWPSALILSFLFGYIHLGNPGEAKIGAFMAGSFGLLALFSLRRTGSLWFAVGMHAAFDWTETFFYGVPDSGLLAQGHLLNSSFHGPVWLTGGTVGPEGSYFVFLVLILSAVAIHFIIPAKEPAA